MDTIDLRHLEYFCRSAELGSISRASAALQVSQPTMSRQLARLRTQLDADLLERTPTGVVPTEAGRALYELARELLDRASALPGQVRAAGMRSHTVTIGIPSGLPRQWFATVIRCMQRELPQIQLDLVEAATYQQRQLLQRAELDIALLHTAPPEAPTAFLFRQDYVVAVPPGSALAGRDVWRLDDLSGLRLLTHVGSRADSDDTHLRGTVAARSTPVDWVLHSFTENLALIAMTSDAAGVVLTAESASYRLPGWTWGVLTGVDTTGGQLGVRTWAAWRDPSPVHVRHVVRLLRTTPYTPG